MLQRAGWCVTGSREGSGPDLLVPLAHIWLPLDLSLLRAWGGRLRAYTPSLAHISPSGIVYRLRINFPPDPS